MLKIKILKIKTCKINTSLQLQWDLGSKSWMQAIVGRRYWFLVPWMTPMPTYHSLISNSVVWTIWSSASMIKRWRWFISLEYKKKNPKWEHHREPLHHPKCGNPRNIGGQRTLWEQKVPTSLIRRRFHREWDHGHPNFPRPSKEGKLTFQIWVRNKCMQIMNNTFACWIRLWSLIPVINFWIILMQNPKAVKVKKKKK